MGSYKGAISPSKQLFIGALLVVSCVFLLCLFHDGLLVSSVLTACGLFLGGIIFGYYCACRQLFSLCSLRPSSSDIIGIMQRQRHDFLNHLQVVSGLAQLKKIDRVMEYVAIAAQELDCERSVTKFFPAETGLALLNWVQRLRNQGIPCHIDFSADLSQIGCGVRLAALLTELLANVVDEKSKPKEILLSSRKDDCIELRLIIRGHCLLSSISLMRSRELARRMGGILLVDQLEGMVQIRLLLPSTAASLA
ncbi:MAG: hypothetical protein GX489_09095 [Firmicutes bacterium]|jgi:hypothetical protein|nr:hypothetical protein [Bacillota bacterium]